MVAARLTVLNDGREIAFTFDEMLKYHGGGSPGGVAHAFKVLQRALPLLDDRLPERERIVIATAFGGPGARDGFELVTRAETQQRYVIDTSLARPQDGRARERFVFRLRHRDRAVTLALRPGFVTDEFIDLTRCTDRSEADERRLTAMKQEMADRVISAPPDKVYDVI